MLPKVFNQRPSLFIALMLGTAFVGATPAFAGCTLVGDVAVIGSIPQVHCDTDYIYARMESDATLTVDNLATGSSANGPGLNFYAPDTAQNPFDLTVNLTGTTQVTAPNYDGVDVRSYHGGITLNIGKDVLINPSQAGVHVESAVPNTEPDYNQPYDGGNVVINNYGTVIAGPDNNPMGADGIDGLSHGGSVTISNYGSVSTSTQDVASGRGIVADGGFLATQLVQVSIYNYGNVSSLHDGLRVNSYNGLGLAVNGEAGTITSTDRRGVVVWSKRNDARFENYGSVTALDSSGAMIWAEGTETGSATLINGGTITAYDNPDSDVTDSVFVATHVWSEVKGDATLTNLAGGSLIAHNDRAAWVMSTDGSVVVDNAGLIKGQTVALYVGADRIEGVGGDVIDDYLGAVGGDLLVTNSGLMTAFETISNPTEKSGIVTLDGDVGTLNFTNAAGGIVGAGLDLTAGFDSDLLGQSLASRSTLSTPASNMAVYSAAVSDETNIDNAGTLIGRIRLDTPDYAYDVGATTSGTAEIRNSGLWVTSGSSAINGGFADARLINSGDLWSLGEADLRFNVDNTGGRIVVAGTTGTVPELKIDGDYEGSENGTIAFLLDSGTSLGANRMVAINGDVGGFSKVDMLSIAGWDWQSDSSIDLIRATGTVENGAESFSMARPVVGLVNYDLNYDDFNQIWSLSASLSEQSTRELGEVSGGVSQSFTYLTDDITNRTDDLRDLFEGETTQPIGYASTPSTPADAAMTALTPPDNALRFWVKGSGALGTTDDYDLNRGLVEVGADASTNVGGGYFGGGAFGALSSTHLSFSGSTSEATLTGYSGGVYGTYQSDSGLFASATAAVEHSDIDLSLSDMPASITALTYGARAELGYRLDTEGMTIEPSVALRASSAATDGFTMNDVDVAFTDRNLFATEARVRVTTKIATEAYDVMPFAVLAIGNETGGDNSVTLSGYDDVAAEGPAGLYASIAAGVSLQSADGLGSAYLRGDVTGSSDSALASFKLGGARKF